MNRRTLLRAGGAGLVVLGCGQETDEPTTPTTAGNVSALAVGTLRLVAGPAVLARDAAGVYAMSAICTHQGCQLGAAGGGTVAAGLACGCHGSRFDGNGAVTTGPASQPLGHFAVEIDAAGEITIRADLPRVATSTRTPV